MVSAQLIDPCLEVVREADWGGIVGVYAHSSTWVIPEGEDEGKQGYWEYDGVISPDDYSTNAARWLESGVQLIGGCCGTRPDHIAPLPGICAACEARMGRWNITRL